MGSAARLAVAWHDEKRGDHLWKKTSAEMVIRVGSMESHSQSPTAVKSIVRDQNICLGSRLELTHSLSSLYVLVRFAAPFVDVLETHQLRVVLELLEALPSKSVEGLQLHQCTTIIAAPSIVREEDAVLPSASSGLC